MTTLPEAGYTPANLRRLMSDFRLTNRDVAHMLGKHENAVHRWKLDAGHARFSSMNHTDWVRLLEYVLTAKPTSRKLSVNSGG